MDGYQNQASKANQKVQSFGFTKHFPKDFMRPYGETVRPHMGTTADFNRKLNKKANKKVQFFKRF